MDVALGKISYLEPPSEVFLHLDGQVVNDFSDRVAQLKSILEQYNYAIVTGFSPTNFVENGAISSDFMRLSCAIGVPTLYESVCGDGVVSNIIPSLNAHEDEMSSRSSNEFELHTDLSYFEKPNEFMGLYVVRPDQKGEAQSQIAQLDDALALLPNDVVRTLCLAEFDFPVPKRADIPSLVGPFSKSSIPRSVLTKVGDRYHIRFRKDTIVPLNDKAFSAIEALSAALEKVKVGFYPEQNTAVFLRNDRVLHARTGFSPTYDYATDRHLQRVWIRDSSKDFAL